MSKITFTLKFKVAEWIKNNHMALRKGTLINVAKAVTAEMGEEIPVSVVRGIYKDLALPMPETGRANQWSALSDRISELEKKVRALESIIDRLEVEKTLEALESLK
jgi:hypothetical protein